MLDVLGLGLQNAQPLLVLGTHFPQSANLAELGLAPRILCSGCSSSCNSSRFVVLRSHGVRTVTNYYNGTTGMREKEMPMKKVVSGKVASSCLNSEDSFQVFSHSLAGLHLPQRDLMSIFDGVAKFNPRSGRGSFPLTASLPFTLLWCGEWSGRRFALFTAFESAGSKGSGWMQIFGSRCTRPVVGKFVD